MYIPIPDENELLSKLPEIEKLEYVTKGGFKAVFKGRHKSGNEEAVKAIFIPEEGDVSPEIRGQLVARAMREIRALGEQLSKTMVRLGDLEPEELILGGHSYIVYSEEYVNGNPLSDRVKNFDKLSYPELSLILSQFTDLIEDLWKNNYLHRDLKPANIMETRNPTRPYVVLDMGIAYKMTGTDLTLGVTPPGTVRYMAPELLELGYKDQMDFRSDLYSLGVTIFELATGSNPFAPSPQDVFTTRHKILTETPPRLENLRPDLPAKFCRIIDRCIKKRIALRYSQFDQLRKQLSEVTK